MVIVCMKLIFPFKMESHKLMFPPDNQGYSGISNINIFHYVSNKQGNNHMVYLETPLPNK